MEISDKYTDNYGRAIKKKHLIDQLSPLIFFELEGASVTKYNDRHISDVKDEMIDAYKERFMGIAEFNGNIFPSLKALDINSVDNSCSHYVITDKNGIIIINHQQFVDFEDDYKLLFKHCTFFDRDLGLTL
jgi:hypothetical protein